MTVVKFISVLVLTHCFTLLTLAKKAKITEEDLLPTDETVSLILKLSDEIKDCFTNATGENYDSLLRNLYEYYNNLDDIYSLLTEKEVERKHNGTRLMARIVDYGEPIHVKEKINYNDLRFKFAWDDNKVREVKEVVTSTRSLWENCEFLYNEMAFDEFADLANSTDIKQESDTEMSANHNSILFFGMMTIFKFSYQNHDVLKEEPTTEEIVSFFLNLAKTINNCLSIPTWENGNLLLKSLHEYNNNFLDWLSIAIDSDKEKRGNSSSLVFQLSNSGSPSFLKQDINFDRLKVVFEWNDRSMQELYDVIKSIKVQWKNIECSSSTDRQLNC